VGSEYRRSALPFFISEPYDQARDPVLFEQRVRLLKEIGYDGIELGVRNPAEIDLDRFRALLADTGLAVAALGTGRAYAVDRLSFTDPDAAIRRQAVQRIKLHLDFARQIGHPPVIIGLVRGSSRATERTAALARLREAMRECADWAGQCGVRLALEPINRYETDLLNTVEAALAFVEPLRAPHVGLLLDTFHMNIEEVQTEASIAAAGSRIFHVHVADSNRRAPGWGHLDFGRILQSLRQAGYAGYLSAETLHDPDPEDALRQAFSHLRASEAPLRERAL
jgi:5-keto-L-gluconate epimerase